jgi:hypothetical protein
MTVHCGHCYETHATVGKARVCANANPDCELEEPSSYQFGEEGPMHCGVLMLPILWGMPGPSAYEAEQRGELIVGESCMVSPMNPNWQCSVCGHRHYPTMRRS